MPPSTGMLWPVTIAACCEHRNATSAAISSGLPWLRNGMRAWKPSVTASTVEPGPRLIAAAHVPRVPQLY
jgi:hypothetical protein